MEEKTLAEVILIFREEILKYQKCRDKHNSESAQHYWFAFITKRFELAYEHISFAYIVRMHLLDLFSIRQPLSSDDKKIYSAFVQDSKHYLNSIESVNTLITEKLLDMQAQIWVCFENILKSVYLKLNLERKEDFTKQYKWIVKELNFDYKDIAVEFFNGYKLIRHSEHQNYTTKKILL